MSKYRTLVEKHPWVDEVGFFIFEAVLRSLVVLAWVFNIAVSIFFAGLFFSLLCYPGEDNIWEPTQLLAFLNLLWMVPVVVVTWTGCFRLWVALFD